MRACLLLFMLLLSACGTVVHYVPTNSQYRSGGQRAATSVDVYTSSLPAVPYVEIGYLEAEEGSFGGMEQTITDLRHEAGRYGCDAIIMGSLGTATDWDPWIGLRTERRYQATCIVYADGAESQEAQEAPSSSESGADQEGVW